MLATALALVAFPEGVVTWLFIRTLLHHVMADHRSANESNWLLLRLVTARLANAKKAVLLFFQAQSFLQGVQVF